LWLNGSPQSSLEDLAYPVLSSSEVSRLTLERNDPRGPAGTVRIDMVTTDAMIRDKKGRRPSKKQFWLDPSRGHIAVRWESTEGPFENRSKPAESAELRHQTGELDGFRQSPRGVWDPTVLRLRQWSTEPGRPAERNVSEQTLYLYLDFDAPLPDELFQPTPIPP
jgi:hypothetical protein